MSEPKEELTTRDLCTMFDVSRQTILNWRNKGLQSYKLTGNGLSDPVRFKRQAVLEFAEKKNKTVVNKIY